MVWPAAVLISTEVAAQGITDIPTLLIPGQYHEGEAPRTLGPGWLALVPVTGGWVLAPAQAKSQRVVDSVVDGEGQATGVLITAQADTLALLRLPGLRAGPVKTPDMRFKDRPRPLAAQALIHLPLNGTRYQLHVEGNTARLSDGQQATPLTSITISGPAGEDSASLLWAGDLDGDGRLDLLVSYTGYNQGGVCLYLSSRAAPGALIGHVACHGGVGC